MEKRNSNMSTVAYIDLVMTVQEKWGYLFLLKYLYNIIVIKYSYYNIIYKFNSYLYNIKYNK